MDDNVDTFFAQLFQWLPGHHQHVASALSSDFSRKLDPVGPIAELPVAEQNLGIVRVCQAYGFGGVTGGHDIHTGSIQVFGTGLPGERFIFYNQHANWLTIRRCWLTKERKDNKTP